MLPQHFQQAALRGESLAYEVIQDFLPHGYGLIAFEYIEGALSGNSKLEISKLVCRLPDGARVRYTAGGASNADLDDFDFAQVFEEDAVDGKLDLYLCLPKLHASENNVVETGSHLRKRYVKDEVELHDLSSGDEALPIEIKQLRPFIAAGNMSRANCHVLPIGRIAGGPTRMDQRYIPPCLSVKANGVLHDIFKETLNRLQEKHESLRDFWNSKDTAQAMRTHDAFKVQTVAMAYFGFAQLKSLTGQSNMLHPFVMYQKMVDTIALLSLYAKDDDLLHIPTYDHNRLGHCFHKVKDSLWRLLDLLEEVSYFRHVFEQTDNTFDVSIDSEWMNGKYRWYICFESDTNEHQIRNMVLQRFKIAPSDEIPNLLKSRLDGIEVEWVPRHPQHLPTNDELHYFEIKQTGDLFEHLRDHTTLSIWGNLEFSRNHTLFIVPKKDSHS